MTTISGIPAHILLVHAVVVLVPLSALLIVLVAVWPAARRRLATATAVLAVATAIIVPVATEAGEWLERRVASTDLVRAHTELGDTMVPWAVALAVVALALAVREIVAGRARRRAPVMAGGGPGTTRTEPVRSSSAPRGRVVGVALAILAVVVAAGSVLTVYRVGESGSRAVWTGQFSQEAAPRSFPAGSSPSGG